MQNNNENCVTKKNPNTLKKNHPCFLRYGVEVSKNQSFLACIADLYETLVHNNSGTISIDAMKKIIIKAVTIENFIKYNNGNLPHIFVSKNNELIESINIESYNLEPNFYKQFTSNPSQLIVLKKIINSYT